MWNQFMSSLHGQLHKSKPSAIISLSLQSILIHGIKNSIVPSNPFFSDATASGKDSHILPNEFPQFLVPIMARNRHSNRIGIDAISTKSWWFLTLTKDTWPRISSFCSLSKLGTHKSNDGHSKAGPKRRNHMLAYPMEKSDLDADLLDPTWLLFTGYNSWIKIPEIQIITKFHFIYCCFIALF